MSLRDKLLGNRDKLRNIDTAERTLEKKTGEFVKALKGEPVPPPAPREPRPKR
jgi:hypothetical protein